jgi:hypothetical protein
MVAAVMVSSSGLAASPRRAQYPDQPGPSTRSIAHDENRRFSSCS